MKYILLVVASVVAMGLNATEEVTWTLVTNMNNLPDGTYAIVNQQYKALSSITVSGTIGYGIPTDNAFVFDANNEATSVPAGVMEFEITNINTEVIPNRYSIKENKAGGLYLSALTGSVDWKLGWGAATSGNNNWSWNGTYWRWNANSASLCFHGSYFDATASSTAKTPIYLVRKTVTVIPDPTPDYTRDFATTDLTTICLPRAVASGDFTGAEFYRVLYKEGSPVTDIVLEQVPALAAGKPYIVVPTADRLECYYSGEATSAGNENGLYGTLTAITDGEAGAVGNKLEHNWVIYNNEFWRCGASCNMSANRAYLVMDEVPTQAQAMPVPGRQQMSVSKAQQGGVGTELSHPTEMPENTKYLYNGRLLIRHNGQVYDVMGRINAGQR
ncbi:MAG: hypothetical protein IJP52_05050 [Paludibacteraceae bacterium]|nr:hypothetical protein [Paludibacteraceae bacterium]